MHGAVCSAPVGDDHPGKTPFIAQYLIQEHVIFSAPPAADLVIGGHDAVGIGFFNCCPEGGEVDLAHSPLTDDHVYCTAIVFLVIQCIVFQAYGHAVVLDALRIAGREP